VHYRPKLKVTLDSHVNYLGSPPKRQNQKGEPPEPLPAHSLRSYTFLSGMGTHSPIRKTVVPEPPVIPDKLYFRIGDVATLLDLPAYVLRFWETEFPQLKPNKGGTGQRLYRKKDVEMALRIKSLLYDEGYTIPGARQVFKAEAKTKESGVPEAIAAPRETAAAAEAARPQLTGRQTAQLHALRLEMIALLADLSAPIGTQPTAVEASAPIRAKLKPMRPRLAVLETKPEPAAKLKLHQRDLFGGE
jgi:DNA-binding transcriptional MerR regulator